MIRIFVALIACLVVGGCSTTGAHRKEPPRQIPIGKVPVLPLELSADFQIRKSSFFFNDPREASTRRPSADLMINFERQRVNFGAVSGYDRSERFGHYFHFFWRAKREADITVRLEYRQENLGSQVQAKEYIYPKAKGSIETTFTIIGDEYAEDGRVTSWRLLLIENGKIVGLHQSFLWN